MSIEAAAAAAAAHSLACDSALGAAHSTRTWAGSQTTSSGECRRASSSTVVHTHMHAMRAACMAHTLTTRRDPALNSSSTQRSMVPSAFSYLARHSAVVMVWMLGAGAYSSLSFTTGAPSMFAPYKRPMGPRSKPKAFWPATGLALCKACVRIPHTIQWVQVHSLRFQPQPVPAT